MTVMMWTTTMTMTMVNMSIMLFVGGFSFPQRRSFQGAGTELRLVGVGSGVEGLGWSGAGLVAFSCLCVLCVHAVP